VVASLGDSVSGPLQRCLAVAGSLMALLVLPGCGSGETTSAAWRSVPADTLTSAQSRQIALAEQARATMFERLKTELMQSLQGGDPGATIGFCKEVAPAIAERVSDEFGVEISRTSFRLRNPKNAPPGWARAAVESEVSEPRYFAYPKSGALGALLPIKMQAACLLCHGGSETLPAAVSESLSQHYPNDQATGFAVNDLRGYFVVVAPASSSDS